MSNFVTVPCSQAQANTAIQCWHRHHSPLSGGSVFCAAIATEADMIVRAVAIVGRPASVSLEDGFTCEVRRLASDGTPNACSKLLGICRRVAFSLGFTKVQTYTMESESGSSLRAAGWIDEHRTDGSSGFSRRVKPRQFEGCPRVVGTQASKDRERQQCVKIRWAASCQAPAAIAVWPEPTSTQPSLFDAAIDFDRKDAAHD